MPVWGEDLSRLEIGDPEAERATRIVIDRLADYLGQLQRPAALIERTSRAHESNARGGKLFMRTKRWKLILIVVADPFARAQPAATKAAAIAKRCGARLVFFNTFMMPQPIADAPMDSHEQIIAAAIRQRKERLEELAARLHVQRDSTCIVRWDFPIHEAVVRQVRQTKPDLVVAESHRHGRLARIVLANTDWQLIRDCPTPLWFVRSPELPRRPRVLVAIDPRHTHDKPARLDDRLLQSAHTLTAQLDGVSPSSTPMRPLQAPRPMSSWSLCGCRSRRNERASSSPGRLSWSAGSQTSTAFHRRSAAFEKVRRPW